MTSPDFRPYVDLTIFDKQPRDIYTEAVEYATVALPELSVRPGTLEDALFQAMSFVSGEVIASVNRLPNGLMEGILNLFGFARIEATYATGSVQFTMIDTAGGVIPAGTQVGYTEIADGVTTFHTFSTTAAVTITEGSSVSPAVNIIADVAGVKPALLDTQEMVVVSASNRILSAALASDLVIGELAENDTEYFSRGMAFLGSLSATMATAEQIRNYILTNYVDVHRCQVYDLTELLEVTPTLLNRSSGTTTATVPSGHGITANSIIRIYGAVPNSFNGIRKVATSSTTSITFLDSGTNASTTTHGYIQKFTSLNASAAAEVAGSVTIFVSAENGASVSAATKSAALADVADRTTAGLDIYIADAIIVPIEVAITIKTLYGYSPSAVATDVEAYIEDYLSPNGWDWSNRIRKTQIIARLAQLTGVDYIESITLTVASGYGDLAVVDASGDIIFVFDGSLPTSSAVVSEVV